MPMLMKSFDSLEKIMDDFDKGLKDDLKIIKRSAKFKKNFNKHLAVSDVIFKSIGKSFKNIVTFGFDLLGIILQLSQSMGILTPILNMVAGIFGIMGGAAMESLGPVLKELAEFLFSDEMILFWEELGIVIGDFMSYIIENVMTLLSDPKVRKLIIHAVEAIISILIHLGKIFGWLISILANMNISALGALIYFLGITLALFKGMSAAPGTAGVILGGAMAAMMAVALAPLMSMATGGYVGSAAGGTHVVVGEGGEGEFIIPESKMDSVGGGEEQLWATEANGRRLDRLIGAIETQNKIKRLRRL